MSFSHHIHVQNALDAIRAAEHSFLDALDDRMETEVDISRANKRLVVAKNRETRAQSVLDAAQKVLADLNASHV